MTRKIVTTTVPALLALMLLLVACAPVQGSPAANTPAPQAVITLAPEAPTTTPDTPAQPGRTVYDQLVVMLPILDSLVRTMGIEGEVRYSAQDAELIWDFLYLMGENYGATHPLVTVEGDVVTVPRAAMEAFAGAAFFDCAGLLEQPERSREAAVYDAAIDACRLAPSDMGAAEVALERWYALPDGTVVAVMGLYNVDEWLGALRFTLTDNPGPSSRYPYSVKTVCRNSGDGEAFMPLSMTEENSVDLDGDGKLDAIDFQTDEDDNVSMRIRLENGRTFDESFGHFYNAGAHFSAVPEGAGLLYVSGDTASSDYETRIYRVKAGALEQTSVYGAPVGLTEAGEALINDSVDLLGTYGGVCRYRLANDAFRFDRCSDYAVAQYDWDARVLTTKKAGLTVTDAATGQTTSLPSGTRLLLLGTDEQSYARLELEDGAQVLLPVEPVGDEYWGWLIGGEAEADWFGELLYAG